MTIHSVGVFHGKLFTFFNLLATSCERPRVFGIYLFPAASENSLSPFRSAPYFMMWKKTKYLLTRGKRVRKRGKKKSRPWPSQMAAENQKRPWVAQHDGYSK